MGQVAVVGGRGSYDRDRRSVACVELPSLPALATCFISVAMLTT
jgi:hypothetical protein